MTLAELARARRVLVCLGADAGAVAAATGARLLPGDLDEAAAWRTTLSRLAPAAAARLLDDPFFHAVAASFPGLRAYLALDELLEHAGPVVLDAEIDWLDAPARVRGLCDPRLVRWLLTPYPPAHRGLGLTRFVFGQLEAAAGAEGLAGIARLFAALAPFFAAFAARAGQAEAVLRDAALIVSDESHVAELARRGRRPSAILVGADPDDEPGPAELAGLPEPDWILETLRAERRAGERLRRHAPLVVSEPR